MAPQTQIKYFVRLNSSPESPYYIFSETENGAALNSSTENLTLYKEVPYLFYRTDSGHPFNIGDSWKSNNTGVTVESTGTGASVNGVNSIVSGETLSFTIGENVASLKYFCFTHAGMIGDFNLQPKSSLPNDLLRRSTVEDPVSVLEGMDVSKHCDDCVVEINSLIHRLSEIRNDILTHKDFIETALHMGASVDGDKKLNDKTIEPRVKKWRHSGKIRSVDQVSQKMNNTDDNTNGLATRYGGFKTPIFNETQIAKNATEELEGMSIENVKKFMISVNALLVHHNDKSSLEQPNDYIEAIIPDLAEKEPEDQGKSAGQFSANYKPGRKFKLNDEMLYILMGVETQDENGLSLNSSEKKQMIDDIFWPTIRVDGSKRKHILANTRGFGLTR